MPEPGRKTISQIRAEARRGVLEARVHAQIEEIARRDASNGKPFWDIRLRDAADAPAGTQLVLTIATGRIHSTVDESPNES